MAEDILNIDAVEVLNGIADNSTDIATAAALREATTALRRLAAIKAAHLRYVETDAGNVIFPSIHGHVLHKLLFGAIDEL
jgi:hypothetical protein